MALYLVESALPSEQRRESEFEIVLEKLGQALQSRNAGLVEVQAARDLSRAFIVVEAETRDPVREAFQTVSLPMTLVKSVRLVGADLADVRRDPKRVRYLVEWNLPETLTLDAYLERKKQNSVHYAEVPQVQFQRTYVCEDMTKCVCLYDGPDVESIYQAREAVHAPVDAVTETVPVAQRSAL